MSEETAFNPVTYEKEVNAGYEFQNCEVYPLQLKDRPHQFKPTTMPMAGAFAEEEAKDFIPEEYHLSNVFDADY